MTKRNRTHLKGFFLKGNIPTESNFADLIDSQINLTDDPLFISPNGNVGVGTTEPGNFKLKVQGDAQVTDTLTANALTISGKTTLNGNVGIGSADPGVYKLKVEGNTFLNGTIRGNEFGALRIESDTGYVDVGSQNEEWTHFKTDRDKYHFDKEIRIDSGKIGSYNENLTLATKGTARITVKHTNGNVGIGTTTPHQDFRLDVHGGWLGSSDKSLVRGGWRLGRWPEFTRAETYLYLSRADSKKYQDLAVGALWAGGDRRFGTASDLAEMTPVKSDDGLESGDVVVIAEPSDNRVLLAKCCQPYDKNIAGVVSDMKSAGLVIGGCHTDAINQDDVMPIALAGRVLTKVNIENGPIIAGDVLTSSSTPGYAMKAVRSGCVLGKALQSFNGEQEKETSGRIWILVNLSWYYEAQE